MLNFKKKSQNNVKAVDSVPTANGNSVVENVSNWYSDRYNSTVVQRNILFILLVASIALVIISSVIVGSVSSNFKIQPFVIDIEEKTGVTTIVNPLVDKELVANDALNKYFLMTYVRAREEYYKDSWRYDYLTVVRLLSSPQVYNDFRSFLNSSASPLAIYGDNASLDVEFRSVQLFPGVVDRSGIMSDSQAVIRFTVFPGKGGVLQGVTGNRMHKILTLKYRYDQTRMSNEDREINPLGFFVTAYRTDIENNKLN
jgi:type IV secretion system protein VirB8